MSVVFFHQNEVLGAQGGIERYLATLLEQAGESGFLVTGTSSGGDARAAGLALVLWCRCRSRRSRRGG